MLAMMATGSPCRAAMIGVSRNMMTGMSELGVVWIAAAAAVVIAVVVLLIRGVARA